MGCVIVYILEKRNSPADTNAQSGSLIQYLGISI